MTGDLRAALLAVGLVLVLLVAWSILLASGFTTGW